MQVEGEDPYIQGSSIHKQVSIRNLSRRIGVDYNAGFPAAVNVVVLTIHLMESTTASGVCESSGVTLFDNSCTWNFKTIPTEQYAIREHNVI